MTTTCQTEPKVDQKDLVEKFAKALARYRVADIEPLLAEGEYNYYDIDGEEVEEGNREGYIDYLKRVCEPMRFTAADPATIEFDQCSFCRLGNPVVLLNGGTFPYNSEKFYQRKMAGMMLEFEDDKINGVTYCWTFVKSENPSLHECRRDEGRPEGVFDFERDMEEYERSIFPEFDLPSDIKPPTKNHMRGTSRLDDLDVPDDDEEESS